MSAAPEVSVVIPTKDRWRYLRAAIASALGQLGVSVEVLVVDDCSGDETATRLARIADQRLRVFRSDAPLGVAAARNTGLTEARGGWVAFLDDDDLWSPRKLQQQLAAAQAGQASFAYGAAVYLDDSLDPIELVAAPDPEGLLAKLLRANVIPAGSSNVVAAAGLLRRMGGFDERLSQIADWDLWIRLAQAGQPAAVHEPLVAYRMHAGNMVLTHESGAMEEIERLGAKHADLEAEEGVRIDGVRHSRWIAWARRRDGRRVSAAATYLRGAVRYRNLGNVARAVGALAGERAMALAAGSKTPEFPTGTDLAWLDDYR